MAAELYQSRYRMDWYISSYGYVKVMHKLVEVKSSCLAQARLNVSQHNMLGRVAALHLCVGVFQR